MNDLMKQLSEPFEPQFITWKPGSTTKDGAKCLAMAYADLRAYQDRLDALCGFEWSVEYQPWGESRVIARLTINGVTRASTGEMDAQDQKNGMGGTVAEAQAFKRAAAMFGLGRYLYDLPSAWVEFDAAAKRISKAGQDELDRRYAAYYAKHIAKAPQKGAEPRNGTPPAQRTTPTATTPQRAPVQATGDVAASAKQLEHLDTIGYQYYGDKWPDNQMKWAMWASGNKHPKLETLMPEQADAVIEGIEKRMAAAVAQPQPEAA
jgi:hypothetical protein